MSDFPSPAVANAFVDLNGSPLPQMKMHKLTYVANGWNLAIYNDPLTGDEPEAWDNGPVFRLIWDRIRDFGTTNDGHIKRINGLPYKATLAPDQRDVVERVWGRYKKFSANELSAMTHRPGTPWTITYFGPGKNSPIPDELVREHYKKLALSKRV